MCTPFDQTDSVCDGYRDTNPERGLLYTCGDQPGSESGYSNDAVARPNETFSFGQSQLHWHLDCEYDNVPSSCAMSVQHEFRQGLVARSWTAEKPVPYAYIPCPSFSLSAPVHRLPQRDDYPAQAGVAYRASGPHRLAEALSPAMAYTNAMTTGGFAADSHSSVHTAARASPSSLLPSANFSGTTNDYLESPYPSNIPPYQAESYSFPIHEQSNQYGGHDKNLHYSRRPGLQHLDGRSTNTSAAMERGDSQYSATSTFSRRSRRSLSSGTPSQTIACETCNTSFSGRFRRRNLTRHTRTTHGDDTAPLHACMVLGCGRTYKRSDALRAHEGKKHLDLLGPRPSRLRRPGQVG
ncbi:uncharacterized protein M421DRAFT_94780 [Didymella exigua CBS 183.55]|uniref:C2H2-type domain-containing protein n=1 Tax=Didymella exigua CBS 183.55 TaxID=1150837 RepID=A0A6A5RDD1_9PLEO|nr:uncharacterized protein M421DRAFT_94780 [Didymella exigua CBS 183.55]KAF1925320.1 hypothetical protein M421DRAFT_94780 [Didymella exigua CBS 183.55]